MLCGERPLPGYPDVGKSRGIPITRITSAAALGNLDERGISETLSLGLLFAKRLWAR
jgi:hypothetical protein